MSENILPIKDIDKNSLIAMINQIYEDLFYKNKNISEEILNSDKDIYFGSNQYNGTQLKTIKGKKDQFEYMIKPKLGPLSGLILIHKK